MKHEISKSNWYKLKNIKRRKDFKLKMNKTKFQRLVEKEYV